MQVIKEHPNKDNIIGILFPVNSIAVRWSVIIKVKNEFLKLINKYTNVGIDKEYMKTVFNDLEKREDYEREL